MIRQALLKEIGVNEFQGNGRQKEKGGGKRMSEGQKEEADEDETEKYPSKKLARV